MVISGNLMETYDMANRVEILNGSQDRYVVPGPEVYLYVMKSSWAMVHVLEPGPSLTQYLSHASTEPTVLPMYCGLKLYVGGYLDMMTMEKWDQLVETELAKQSKGSYPRLLNHERGTRPCLKCNKQFNQSEIAC